MNLVSILVGVFVTARVSHHHRTRMQWSLDHARVPGCNISMVFVEGRQDERESVTTPPSHRSRTIHLPIHENVNDGKTYHWFKHAHAGVQAGTYTADVVFKMDSDTSVDWAALCQETQHQHTSRNARYYMGRVNANKCNPQYADCPDPRCRSFQGDCWVYMSGGFYGLSRAALADVMQHAYTHANIVGTEDVLTGMWMKRAVPDARVINRDNGDIWCHTDAFRTRYPVIDVRRSWLDCVK